MSKSESVGESFLNEFERLTELSREELIRDLLTSDDVEVKTEINQPVVVTTLDTIAFLLNEMKLERASKILNFWLLQYRINMISHKRKSRREYVEAIKGAEVKEMEEEYRRLKKFLGIK